MLDVYNGTVEVKRTIQLKPLYLALETSTGNHVNTNTYLKCLTFFAFIHFTLSAQANLPSR